MYKCLWENKLCIFNVIIIYIFNRIKQGDLMQKFKKVIKILIIFYIVIVCSSNTIFAYEAEETLDYIWLNEEIANVSSNSTEEPILSSRYVEVLDRTSKEILYGKNENARVPMASTTKIMTAIVLLENMEKNNLSLESEIEVCKQAANIGGSRLGLKVGDKITINDLLYGLMLCSRE